MSLAVLMPWRSGDDRRLANLDWTLSRYEERLPGVPVVFGSCRDDEEFNRAACILDAASKTDAEILIVADADCWSDGVHGAVAAVQAGWPWAVPHEMLHRLDENESDRVLAGVEPHLSMKHDQPRYRGHECGTLLVIRHDVLDDVPPDPRFVGFGREDDAWAHALRALVGPPWRGEIYHLWHEPQPRVTRAHGNAEIAALYKRYSRAVKNDGLRALIDEAKEAWREYRFADEHSMHDHSPCPR